MCQDMSMEIERPGKGPLMRWWHSRSFIQRRLIRMCLSMMVMMLCFPLYYLGLFGTVEGPLNPARLGDHLARMGVTRIHCLMLFLTLMIMALTWNWIYNFASLLAGSRFVCVQKKVNGRPCGAGVVRRRIVDPKSGRKRFQYVCAKGHRQYRAGFQPLKKGTVSHCLWLISAAFCGMVVFMAG